MLRTAIVAALACAACSTPCRAPESSGVCVRPNPRDGGGCEWIHAAARTDGSAFCPAGSSSPSVVFDAGTCPYQPEDEAYCE